MSVKDDVRLDINNLDKEWERQSELMEEYSSALSNLNREYSDMKLVLDGIIAEKKIRYRTDGEIFYKEKTTKVTEGALSDAIDCDIDITNQKKLLVEKQYQIDMIKGIVEALRHKKSALEREVDLYIAGYFSTPKDQRTMMKDKQRN